MAKTTSDLVEDKIVEKFARTASKATCEDKSELHAQIDETLTQPIGKQKEKYISPRRQ